MLINKHNSAELLNELTVLIEETKAKVTVICKQFSNFVILAHWESDIKPHIAQ